MVFCFITRLLEEEGEGRKEVRRSFMLKLMREWSERDGLSETCQFEIRSQAAKGNIQSFTAENVLECHGTIVVDGQVVSKMSSKLQN